MFQTALAVCLGILAAVAILSWWDGRHERREAAAYRRMGRAAVVRTRSRKADYVAFAFMAAVAVYAAAKAAGG